MGKYKTLQLDTEIHAQLQEYCIKHDKRMSKFVGRLIKEKLGTPIRKIDPTKVLKTQPRRISSKLL